MDQIIKILPERYAYANETLTLDYAACSQLLLPPTSNRSVLIMKLVVFTFVFMLFSIMQPYSAKAAEISIILKDKEGTSALLIKGEITEGDASVFDRLIEDVGNAIVYLDSPGGLLNEAFSIGSEIRHRGIATSVSDDSSCFSACTLIWLAGSNRYMSNGALIGFHAAYNRTSGRVAKLVEI